MKYNIEQYKQPALFGKNDSGIGRYPYRRNEKYTEPTICTDCGALYSKGRWNWDDLPAKAAHAVCPACHRTRDRVPAGIIELSGPFFEKNKEKIIRLMNNIHRNEIAEHPLERIMEMQENDKKITISTTGVHIARRLGDAVHNAYKGKLRYTDTEENFIRVYWQR